MLGTRNMWRLIHWVLSQKHGRRPRMLTTIVWQQLQAPFSRKKSCHNLPPNRTSMFPVLVTCQSSRYPTFCLTWQVCCCTYCLWLHCVADVDIIFSSCGFFFLSFFYLLFLALSQPSHIGCLPYFYTWCALSANLGCRSKICHMHTITQLYRAICLQLRHVSTIGKKLVKQQYLRHMSLQCGELQPPSSWDWLVSFGYPR